MSTISLRDRVKGALYGMFIGDALAMPVHWYYDIDALKRDYGLVTEYQKPHNPHPDSILWRSSYIAASKAVDILHDHAKFWGKRNIHYHQFLRAGENTLNVQLARELLILIENHGEYDRQVWLEKMVSFLTTPGQHNDTYIEEYLRDFFTNLSRGKPLSSCGRGDEKHIGGFTQMLPLLLVLAQDPSSAKKRSLQHLALTHGGKTIRTWAEFIAVMMLDLLSGNSLVASLKKAVSGSNIQLNIDQLQAIGSYPDTLVVGRHFSSACYVEHAIPATIYLALKYSENLEEALVQNTMCGGDNAGRGAVLGAILGALHGSKAWPDRWSNGLVTPPPVVTLD